MIDPYPYSPEVLEELYQLRKGDIFSLIKFEGVPLYSPLRDEFVGYLPSLASSFRIDASTFQILENNVKNEDFVTEVSNNFVLLKTTSPTLPPSAILYTPDWYNKFSNLIPKDNYLMFTSRIHSPILFGKKKELERIAVSFPKNDKVIHRVSYFMKEM